MGWRNSASPRPAPSRPSCTQRMLERPQPPSWERLCKCHSPCLKTLEAAPTGQSLTPLASEALHEALFPLSSPSYPQHPQTSHMLAQGSRSECSSEQDRNCMTFCEPASEARSHHCCLLLVEAVTNPPRFTGGGLRLCFVMKGDSPGGSDSEEPTCDARRCKRPRFNPWIGKIPWMRKWQPTPVFLPG